jgi:16S rRNA (guanine(966)-N(2))-methyltransferase RsmD
MPIRVVGGSAKGRKLKIVPGDSTRPVMDRVKESLFNILGDWVVDTYWLDLFAGTGSIGIEALSRGANHCVFLDLDRAAVRTIHENLKVTRFEAQAEVSRTDAFVYLRGKPPIDPGFDVIYVAPPQYLGLWNRAVQVVDENPSWIVPDGLVIVQIDPREYADLELKSLRLYDQRRYGNTILCFYERPGA